MTYDIMIDIETLGTTADSVVLSVGVVKFSGDKILDSKEYILPSKYQINNLHRRVQVSTIDWWSSRSNNARKVLKDVQDSDKYYHSQPHRSIEYICANILDHLVLPDVRYIWFKGFDMGVLSHLFTQLNLDMSGYDFRKEMDFRTIENLVKHTPEYQKFRKTITITHNAVDDCLNQIKLLNCALGILNYDKG